LFAVRASLAGDVLTFSPANVGGELLLAVSPWRLRFELAGSYRASSTATLAGSPSEGARLELATLGVRANAARNGSLESSLPSRGQRTEP
jgi:hypothetical protein